MFFGLFKKKEWKKVKKLTFVCKHCKFTCKSCDEIYCFLLSDSVVPMSSCVMKAATTAIPFLYERILDSYINSFEFSIVTF